MVSSMKYLSGCRRIFAKFKAMSARDEKEMSEWVNDFHKNKDNFSESLSDFETTNVCDYLKYVYETKCHINMEQLFAAFGCVLIFLEKLY